MKKILFILFIIQFLFFTSTAYALNPITFSGRLKDAYNNPIQANVSLYQRGAGDFANSSLTDSNGNYSLLVPEGLYDIQFSITSFSKPFWIKFLSVYIGSDINGLLVNVTESEGNISFVINSSENYTIQLYSDKIPRKVLINNTSLANVSSILNLTSDKWFFNESNLYIMLYKKSLPWIQVEGQWVVDELGRRTALRGGGGSYNAYNNWDDFEKFLQEVKSIGGNAYRLGFNPRQTPGKDYAIRTTTGDGVTDGSTLVDSNISNPSGFWVGEHVYIENGPAAGQGSWVTGWDLNTHTLTVSPNFSQQITSGVEYGMGWADKMSQWDPAKVDRTLDLLEKYGIYGVLTCMHWQGPDWQLVPNYKNLWVQTWVEIANRYKNRSIVAGYELCNECWGAADMDMEAIDAIKKVDQNHMFFLIEGAILNGAPGGVYDPYHSGTWGDYYSKGTLPQNSVYLAHTWGGPWTSFTNVNDNPMAECRASGTVSSMLDLRQKYNAPVTLGEFGLYDFNTSHAEAQWVKEAIRMSDNQGFGWWYWMMEKVFWDSKIELDWLNLSYTTSIYSDDIPKPFSIDAKPFSLTNKIIAHGRQSLDYTTWNEVYYQIPGIDAWITIQGPCTVRVREWDVIWWGNMTAEYLVKIPEGQNQTIGWGPVQPYSNYTGRKEIFSYSNSIL